MANCLHQWTRHLLVLTFSVYRQSQTRRYNNVTLARPSLGMLQVPYLIQGKVPYITLAYRALPCLRVVTICRATSAAAYQQLPRPHQGTAHPQAPTPASSRRSTRTCQRRPAPPRAAPPARSSRLAVAAPTHRTQAPPRPSRIVRTVRPWLEAAVCVTRLRPGSAAAPVVDTGASLGRAQGSPALVFDRLAWECGWMGCRRFVARRWVG